MANSLDFTQLPVDLRRRLLLGFSGRPHLHEAASVAFTHSRRQTDVYAQIASDMLLTAWGENPLDGHCVAVLASVLDRVPPLSQALLSTVQSVLAYWKPEVTPEAQAALAGGQDQQLVYLKQCVKASPQNLFWWHHLYEYARIHGDWQPFKDMLLEATPPEGLDPLFMAATAHAFLASGDSRPAAGYYRQTLPSLPLPVLEERLATAWLRSGKREKGLLLLSDCAARRPWHVGLILRVHEYATGGDVLVAQPQGRGMVLAYSWNKADDLAATLDSLARSDLAEVHVRVLDNGSSDHTTDVIRQFVDKFGLERAKGVTLPVNIGAPAARNWLMQLPEVRNSDFVAYIDDDIYLPLDWLQRLGAAAKRYPDAGVWGCKVVNFDGHSRVQCGEHNLTPSSGARQETLMSTIMLQDGDFGQADYMRPCLSVTGCVHLFQTQRLLANGGFDLRFSPTQYDDLERDIRMGLGGGYAVYSGFLSIAHKRTSGALSEVGRPESSGATANLHKLMAKYEAAEFETLAGYMDTVLLADLVSKIS